MSSNDNVHGAIVEANERFMAAFERGDPDAVAALYTDGGQILPPGAEAITGHEGLRAFWAGAMEMGIKRVQLTTVEVDRQGDAAIEVGRAILYAAGGQIIDEGKYVVVWRRDGANWKLHRDIWNSNKPPGT